MKYFSNPTLARCTQAPLDAQLTLRVGIWCWATKATPLSPKSARQTAFHVARDFGCSPLNKAPIFRAVAVTIDSIMNPVFGMPTGTGVGPLGDGDTNANAEYLRIGWIALVFVRQNEAARVGQLFYPQQCRQ